ncbi:DUF4974 domain-containing protein [Olivibacter ginsenosidimutans]|uniref:DUF4974 domain-containing protein n=1 Tax=Olivibacter ginsenosidimutans TaxID=1176537 RepID=A0ABP9B6H1_9SPHI
MEQKRLRELLQKYRQGKCTSAEKAEIENWYDRRLPADFAGISDDIIDADLVEVYHKLPHHPFKHRIIKSTKRWYSFAAAALVLLTVSLAISFYIFNTPIEQQQTITKNDDLMPGTDRAILKLANDSTIALDDAAEGDLVQKNGIKITKDKEGLISYAYQHQQTETNEVNTIITPKGGQYQVILADGTKVWLNAASSLKFPTSFTENDRTVTLEGEGYFEVARDQSRPFKVITSTQTITVLGTHFNVNSYKEEKISSTTLLEGSVRILYRNTQESIRLKQGEQATFTGNKAIEVTKIDPKNAIAWKEGLFRFEGANIKEAMREYARWYDVEVNYEGSIPDVELWGEVYRNNNASLTLEILGYFDIKYQIINRDGVKKIIISK